MLIGSDLASPTGTGCFFAPVRAYFGRSVTKSLDSPTMWYLLIVAPIGANVNATYVMILWPNHKNILIFVENT